MRIVAVSLCVLCVMLCDCTVAAELSAGTARVDLTPPLEWRVPLGGYGARMSRPATGVHDRVFAKALVLSEGDRRFGLVTADVLAFPPPFKQAVLDRLGEGWSAEQLMLLPSHSHTSLDMSSLNPANTYEIPQIGMFHPQVFAATVERVAGVVEEAASQTQPVCVGTDSRKISGWNRNRRSSEGVVDDGLIVTRFDGLDGLPVAVLVNFAAHPTFLSDREMMFSAGWPGHLQRTMEAVIGEGVTVMYYNGAEGDQSPVARADSGASRWERAERYGRELGLLSCELWRTIETRREVVFSHHRQPIALPEQTWHRDYLETGGKEYGLTEELLTRLLPALFPRETARVSVRICDLVIAGVPGEMTAELGLEIKQRGRAISGVEHVAIGGLADEWVSYILSSAEYAKGGYEASVSFYGPDLGGTIVDGVAEGMLQLAP